jgi:serine/threonine protein kinase/tetratricopeptide (TPR) repeat protein
MVGTTISHYKILERLGGGGMGVVYKAEDTRLKRIVALKFLPPQLTYDPEAKERFIHEAQAASALQHDNICTIHDIDETADGQLFICMDFYDGQTLKRKIENVRLRIEDCINIAVQVARGLAKAHETGIVHRDIKPANIMITRDGEAKIVDFGLAKLTRQTRLTKDGSTLGTVVYMSPEQARGEEVDHRSDIWSLGVVLYEMIAGRPPYASEYEQALMYSILNDEVQPIPGCDSRLNAIVLKALQKQPSARYQTMTEFESDLEVLSSELSGTEPRGRSRATGRRIRRTWMLLSEAFLLAAVVVIIGYFLIGVGGKQSASPAKKLVVLPFENLGPAENEYFADGMTEELTSRLSCLSGLRVISRISALQYFRTNKPMQQIGEELGVDYALEGAVRWAPSKEGPSRVRINSSLTRISDRTTLWSETYDRVINDIFAIQTELSQKVVEKMGITFLEPERESIEEPPTKDLEAYQAYLRGRYYESRPHFTSANWAQVVEAYEQAVEIDTGFALAFAELARGHARLYYLWYDHTAGRLELARHAAERALALAPELPGVRLALGYYYLYMGRDPGKAEAEIAIAKKGMPHSAEIFEAETAIFLLQGRWQEAMESAQEAFELSPRDGSLAVDLSEVYWVLRKYPEAVKTCDRAIELTPDDAWPYLMKCFSLWSWKGASSETESVLRAVPANHDWWTWAWYWQEMIRRDYPKAIEHLSASPDPWVRTKCWAMPKLLLAAYAYRLSGERQKSLEQYQRARLLLEAELKEHPDDPRYHSSLGIALAALGQKEEAIREGRRAVELLPISTDALYGIPYVEDLAFIYTLSGETDAALDRLNYLLTIPSWISVTWLRNDPQWDAIRSQPGFIRLLEEHSGEVR